MSSNNLNLSLHKHFLSCPAVLATIAVTNMANASLIVWTLDVTIPNTNAGMYFNVQTQTTGLSSAAVPGWDLNPFGTSTSELNWYAPVQGGCVIGYGASGVNLGVQNHYGLAPIVIGPNNIYGVTSSSVQNGGWTLNADNLFGFKFKNSNFQTLYGAGVMRIGANMGNRKITTLLYESNGSAFIVSAPTPGALPLLALIGFAKRRRRI